ncbi:uncharacterized protein LOC116924640 [Daphnia magna]|uniref:uncharacterized protein LOC116924640 n=1 Tax=Daphnia magna TaxID=35525 RepID=UPI001E1BDC81|nr:uncharacterized protein LOC116924640 [Daphnia magna]
MSEEEDQACSSAKESNAAIHKEISSVLETKLNAIKSMAALERQQQQYQETLNGSCLPPITATEWTKRTEKQVEKWNYHREAIHAAVSHGSRSTGSQKCCSCRLLFSSCWMITCTDCKHYLYISCDRKLLFTSPFHKRRLLNAKVFSSETLLPKAFVNENDQQSLLSVPVPVFIPHSKEDDMSLIAEDKSVIVVTIGGRYDLKSAMFYRESSNSSVEATIEDYLAAQLCPAAASDTTYFFLMCCSCGSIYRINV